MPLLQIDVKLAFMWNLKCLIPHFCNSAFLQESDNCSRLRRNQLSLQEQNRAAVSSAMKQAINRLCKPSLLFLSSIWRARSYVNFIVCAIRNYFEHSCRILFIYYSTAVLSAPNCTKTTCNYGYDSYTILQICVNKNDAHIDRQHIYFSPYCSIVC